MREMRATEAIFESILCKCVVWSGARIVEEVVNGWIFCSKLSCQVVSGFETPKVQYGGYGRPSTSLSRRVGFFNGLFTYL